MSKKSLIISIIAIVVIAGAVFAALLVFKGMTMSKSKAVTATKIVNDPSKDNPATQEALLKPDLSQDLGACTIVTKASITTAIDSKTITVGDAINRGYGKDSTETGSQSCTFAFSAANTQDNRLTSTVTLFTSNDAVTASKSAYAAMTKVSGIGDVAYYGTVETTADSTTTAENYYSFYIFSGMKLYTLTISQPADSDAFTVTTAQAALTTLAKTISL